MGNNYLFIIDKYTGERITTYLDESNGQGEAELKKVAKVDYPDAIYVYDNDAMLNAFMNGKIYVDGYMTDKPVIYPSVDDLKKHKVAEINARYEVRFKEGESALMRARLASNDAAVAKLQALYKLDLAAMVKEIKEA